MTAPYDVGFAHAVRRAMGGLRPKAGEDVAAEGKALAAVLRSGQPLDQHGLELLAQAVTGKLRKGSGRAGETMFAHAVRRASAAWRSGKEDRPAEAGAILAGMLRSRQPPLGTGERELLAELFAPQPANEHDALAGRPPKGAGHPDVVAVMNHLQNEIAKSSLHKNALADTASHFKISVRTVEEYEAITREREAATKAAIRSLYEDD